MAFPLTIVAVPRKKKDFQQPVVLTAHIHSTKKKNKIFHINTTQRTELSAEKRTL